MMPRCSFRLPRISRQSFQCLCHLVVPVILFTLATCAGGPSSAEMKQTLALARARGLVEVTSVIPGIKYDLLYRNAKNITAQRVYPENMPCLLHHTTAAKLRVAQEILQRQGYGLKIWDAWRPPESHTALHDHGGYTGMFTPPEFMWSRHCSGTAVDVTLVDAKGRVLEMPTGFDEGGPDSYYIADAPAKKKEHRSILQMAMTSAGFSILNTEWWHFDDATYDQKGQLPVPPVVYARDIGLKLPTVKPPRVKRTYVYPTTTTTSSKVPAPADSSTTLGGTSYLPGADSGTPAAAAEPAVITTPQPAPPSVMLPTVPSVAPGTP
jgi:D-alanyl-D-alanine dipeptidase